MQMEIVCPLDHSKEKRGNTMQEINNAKISLREKILNAADIQSEIIEIPEWGVKLEIKSLTGKKRAQLMTAAMDSKGQMDFEKLYPDLVIASTYDPKTHVSVFEKTDRDMLNEKNGGALEKISKVALRLSGLEPDSVDNAEKNS